MAKTSQKNNQNSTPTTASSSSTNNRKNPPITKAKRTRKPIPRHTPTQRSSNYRGVTRHRWTGRYEAHLWDKNCWNESQNKKGRQVYLGAYDDEEAAAHAYDLAALKHWGQDTILNFPLSTYQDQIKEMEDLSKEEYIGSLRRHHHNGRWEARIGRVFGNKYLYLGTYATQEEAATAYDMAAIEYRGLNAVTNFDLSRYITWLRPNKNSQSDGNFNFDLNPMTNPSQELEQGLSFIHHHQQQQSCSSSAEAAVAPPHQTGGATASSTVGFLLKSSKFKEMLERSSAADSPSITSESEPRRRRTFPDDIQTYFDCQDSSTFVDGDDTIFGGLSSFTSPIFQYELDA